MGKFTRIPKNTFDTLQLDAGLVLNKFDPVGPTEVQEQDIVCATTGGITASCIPSYSDQGEDVDNCPPNMKELKKLEGWDCKLSFTGLGTSPEMIQMALGPADIAGNKVVPRDHLDQSKDFKDIWWVGDKANGGMVAVCLKNALSTSGFTLKTTKNGKGQISVELGGHVSMEAQTTMPMEFYSTDGAVV